MKLAVDKVDIKFNGEPVQLKLGWKVVDPVPVEWNMESVDLKFHGMRFRDTEPDPEVVALREELRLVKAQRDANADRVRNLESRYERCRC